MENATRIELLDRTHTVVEDLNALEPTLLPLVGRVRAIVEDFEELGELAHVDIYNVVEYLGGLFAIAVGEPPDPGFYEAVACRAGER